METQTQINKQRWRLLVQIDQTLEGPMIFLGFVWLVLLVIDLAYGLNKTLQLISTIIWIIFIIDFLVKLFLAPKKLLFLRKNWLTPVSLVIPALRVFRLVRIIRLARALRGVRFVRIIASINRSMKSLNATMQRRGFSYVVLLSAGVVFAGAAGMYAIEKDHGLNSYWDALWWTLMLIITVGTDFWPKTGEGRALCFVLALFGFAVFGYITATLASFFVGRDAEESDAPIAGASEIEALRKEIAALHETIKELKTDMHQRRPTDEA